MTDITTSVDNIWEHPGRVRFLSAQGEVGRTIRFDPIGQGVSDPCSVEDVGRLDLWVEDAVAVLDALGVAECVVTGESYAGQVGLSLAAEDSGRVRRLALLNPFVRKLTAPDYPIGTLTEGDVDEIAAGVAAQWGNGEITKFAVPSLAKGAPDPGFLARSERIGASPTVAAALVAASFKSDVRQLLTSVSVPTMVIYTGDNVTTRVEESRFVADNIRDAQFLTAPSNSFYWGEGIETYLAFLGGGSVSGTARALRSVLFTDIVDSTGAASAIGDAAWKRRLTHVDEYVGLQITRFGGSLVKQTGDGHLAVFATPTDAIRAASAIIRGAPTLEVEVRTGIHTGEVEERPNGDITGIGVHIAARVAGLAHSQQLLVSRTVADLVAGGAFLLRAVGDHQLKGVQGTWALYEVEIT
jgi:class 3 adenylate cyclase